MGCRERSQRSMYFTCFRHGSRAPGECRPPLHASVLIAGAPSGGGTAPPPADRMAQRAHVCYRVDGRSPRAPLFGLPLLKLPCQCPFSICDNEAATSCELPSAAPVCAPSQGSMLCISSGTLQHFADLWCDRPPLICAPTLAVLAHLEMSEVRRRRGCSLLPDAPRLLSINRPGPACSYGTSGAPPRSAGRRCS